MDVVANAQNVSLLYHLAGRLKTVRDLRDSGDVRDSSLDGKFSCSADAAVLP